MKLNTALEHQPIFFQIDSLHFGSRFTGQFPKIQILQRLSTILQAHDISILRLWIMNPLHSLCEISCLAFIHFPCGRCMSMKQWPVIYSNLLQKMCHYFLDRHYDKLLVSGYSYLFLGYFRFTFRTGYRGSRQLYVDSAIGLEI